MIDFARIPRIPNARQTFAPVTGPRTHAACKAAHGVFRPGKTKRDHATGAWQQGIDNVNARAEANRG